jgi:hypothetical protein
MERGGQSSCHVIAAGVGEEEPVMKEEPGPHGGRTVVRQRPTERARAREGGSRVLDEEAADGEAVAETDREATVEADDEVAPLSLVGGARSRARSQI